MLILFLPFFYLTNIPGRIRSIWSVALLLIFIVWSQFGSVIVEPLVFSVLEDNEELSSYMYYLDFDKRNTLVSGFGAIFRYVVFFIWLLTIPRVNKNQKFLIFMKSMAILLMLSRFPCSYLECKAVLIL